MSEALILLAGAAHQAAKAFKSCSGLLGMQPTRRRPPCAAHHPLSAHVWGVCRQPCIYYRGQRETLDQEHGAT